MLSNRRNQIILGMILLGVAGLAFILYLNVRPEPQIDGVVKFPRPARGLDDTLVFDAAQQAGNALHSMEHGAV